MEKVCRAFKYVIKLTKLHFLPVLSQFLHLIMHAFQQYHHSPFLYMYNICVEHYALLQDQRKLLTDAFQVFIIPVIHTLNNEQAYNTNPDLVEDLYDTLRKILVRCPDLSFGALPLTS